MRKLIITLVVLAVLFVAADRGAEALAEQAIARQLASSQHLAAQPSVELTGFPFLTQVVRGYYDGGEVRMRGLTRDNLTIETLDIRLHGVHIPLSQVLHRSVTQVPVDRVRGTALISYDEVVQAIGVKGLELGERAGKLRVSLPVSIPPVGSVRLSGTAALSVAHGEIRISDVRLGGTNAQIPSAILDPIVAGLGRAVPLDGLPYGLRVTGVKATASGVSVSVAGENVLLDR